MKEFALAQNAYDIHPPKGGMKKGKTPRQVAIEEVAEETGLAAESMEPIGTLVPISGYFNFRTRVFLATGARRMEDPPEGDEIEKQKVLRRPLATAIEMCKDGRIREARAVSALFLAEARAFSDARDGKSEAVTCGR